VTRILLTWTVQAALLARVFILHKNIHTTRVVTFAKELGTMSKNKLSMWVNSFSLHPLLPDAKQTNKQKIDRYIQNKDS